MATVYAAVDHRLGTHVVIKVPRLTLLEESDFARRFDHEIRSLVQLSHPHICRVLDVGVQEGMPFAVLQYLTRGTLSDQQPRKSDGSPLPTEPAHLHVWLKSIAEALDFIHQRGYVHRDVKPSNIMFDEHGYAYLGDFGVAKVVAETDQRSTKTALTRTGVALGTPQYMAPELIMGQPVDGRIDQYALATTVFEMLSARYPFEGATATAILVSATTQACPSLADLNLGLAPQLAQAVNKGLARNAADRFTSCVEFADAVLATVTDRPKKPWVPGSGTQATAGSPNSVAANSSSAPTIYSCPKCGTKFRVRAASQASKARCPSCREVIPLNTAAPQRAAAAAHDETATMGAIVTAARQASPQSGITSAKPTNFLRTRNGMLALAALSAGLLLAVSLGWLLLGRGATAGGESGSKPNEVAGSEQPGDAGDQMPGGLGGGIGLGTPAADSGGQIGGAQPDARGPSNKQPQRPKGGRRGGFGDFTDSPQPTKPQPSDSQPQPVASRGFGMGGGAFCGGMGKKGFGGGFESSPKEKPPEVDRTYELRRIKADLGAINGFGYTLSRDGKLALTWSHGPNGGLGSNQRKGKDKPINQLTQWDLESGEQAVLFPGESNGPVVSACFSPDDQYIGVCRNKGQTREIAIWNRRTNKKVLTEAAADVHSIVFLPDSQRFVVNGGWFGTRATGSHRPSEGRRSAGNRGLGILVGDGMGGLRGSRPTVLLDNIAASTKPRELTGAGDVHGLSVSPDGKVIAAASEKTIVVWDLGNPGAKTFVTDEATGQRRSEADAEPKRPNRRGQGGMLGGNRNVEEPKAHNATKPSDKLELDSTWSAGPVFSSDGSRLAVGTAEGIVLIWDRSTGKITRLTVPQSDEAVRPIRTVRFVRDDRYLFVADGRTNNRMVGVTVRAWNIETGAQSGQVDFADAGSAVGLCGDQTRALYFDPDGNFCLLDGEKLLGALAK
jgi:serine/threonine protein kinase/WD40 repeat protein